ncbi:hypothetical protein HXX76_003825 [Chlamydomonas incerta]|uniref:Uncharacterized protein n=1 Tax=Chlamydomonas incerta TaxID=51695 RepID=A0A835TC66_CHLIN|nr:hypothetical protein HXX76_003825 [Chlamydomonas incerta]|eukprot:KAG2440972.1 hypothetical protein HXX76_003825 [Chlamydomonas incerta]
MPPSRARGHGGAADEEPEKEDPMVKAAKIQAVGLMGGALLVGCLMFAGFYVLADALRGVPDSFAVKLRSLRTSLLKHGRREPWCEGFGSAAPRTSAPNQRNLLLARQQRLRPGQPPSHTPGPNRSGQASPGPPPLVMRVVLTEAGDVRSGA